MAIHCIVSVRDVEVSLLMLSLVNSCDNNASIALICLVFMASDHVVRASVKVMAMVYSSSKYKFHAGF